MGGDAEVVGGVVDSLRREPPITRPGLPEGAIRLRAHPWAEFPVRQARFRALPLRLAASQAG